jgi:phosphotransferase system enzyme I (PtsI)
MILDDSALSQDPEAAHPRAPRQRRVGAGAADGKLTDRFDEIDDAYLRERKADVQQAVERVLKALMGAQTLTEPALTEEQELIVVAHDLSPADMILFKRHHFGGFITDVGGVTSHTAIVARSLGIPAIVGTHHAFQTISERELIIVDGVMGVVIVNPDPVVLAEFRLRQSQLDLEREKLKRLKSKKATDPRRHAGRALRQHRAARGHARGARGGRRGRGPVPQRVHVPQPQGPAGEDEQFEAYRNVAQAMGGRPGGAAHAGPRRRQGASTATAGRRRTFRTRRWACARSASASPSRRCSSPSCGAILRASHYGKVRILLPMLAARARDRADPRPHPPGEAAARRARRRPTTARSRSAA